MDTALIKDFFDCCREAKKILELLPPLWFLFILRYSGLAF